MKIKWANNRLFNPLFIVKRRIHNDDVITDVIKTYQEVCLGTSHNIYQLHAIN
jgi:hypothetical protein